MRLTSCAVTRKLRPSGSGQEPGLLTGLIACERRWCAARRDAGAAARGRAEIEARIRSLTAGLECIRPWVNTIGVIDGRVFVERVDDFDVSGRHVELPVVGILRIDVGVAAVASSSCGDCTRPQLCCGRDLGRRLTSI